MRRPHDPSCLPFIPHVSLLRMIPARIPQPRLPGGSEFGFDTLVLQWPLGLMVLQPHSQKPLALWCSQLRGRILFGAEASSAAGSRFLRAEALLVLIVSAGAGPGLDGDQHPSRSRCGTAEDREVGTSLESCGVRAQHVPPGSPPTEVGKQSSRPRS